MYKTMYYFYRVSVNPVGRSHSKSFRNNHAQILRAMLGYYTINNNTKFLTAVELPTQKGKTMTFIKRINRRSNIFNGARSKKILKYVKAYNNLQETHLSKISSSV
jgi:hypothetical protein